ncbi:hypothetical protein ILUMI_09073 [Ignelater luminosus]|uniref:Uncharacterized protein n=1 Tax=Ignelater luminosus TaxID=2038154 RepID=A0A8K0D4Y3_IGNLU|nr:hypothetical protein ILUMI_09073 [Ignelater luminosus]
MYALKVVVHCWYLKNINKIEKKCHFVLFHSTTIKTITCSCRPSCATTGTFALSLTILNRIRRLFAIDNNSVVMAHQLNSCKCAFVYEQDMQLLIDDLKGILKQKQPI